jgi:glycosyltransferase involved in cell wall biosynthesis
VYNQENDHKKGKMLKRVVFGSTPLINNYYWNEALNLSGYNSKTVMFSSVTYITRDIKWDVYVPITHSKKKFLNIYFQLGNGLRAILSFIQCINQFDVFIISFDGFLIGRIPVIWRCQTYVFKMLKKKVILIPYGGDFYVYKDINSEEIKSGLLNSYPMSRKKQKNIAQRVVYWKKHADLVVPGFAYADIYKPSEADIFGNIFLTTPSPLIVDTKLWSSNRKPLKKGQMIEIAHMPNHRGFKGTDKIVEVVEELKNEGFNIRFHLIERMPNDEVRELMANKIHILIDQIYFIGYALNSIEAMASSCVVMANLSNNTYTSVYSETFLDRCPIINIDKSNIKQALIDIILDFNKINDLSLMSRKYVENFHSYEYFSVIFGEMIEVIYKT